MKLIGFLTIPGGLLCKKDVLGQRFIGTISGFNVGLIFPSLSDSSEKKTIDRVGMSNQLIAPPNGVTLTLGEEKIFWGYPIKAPEMNSFVKRITLEVESNKSDSDELAQKLYAGIDAWTHSFKRFIQLLTRQQCERIAKASNPGNTLQLICNGKYVQNHHPQVLHGQFYGDSIFASYTEIAQAIDFASSGKELFLEYQMLLSAYNARKSGENRQAIIDACAAAEICLVNQIDFYCNQKGILTEVLTEKYKSLGERFNLVKKLDVNSPSFDFGNVIVKPRNDVAHNRNTCPTNECTDKLIEMVEKYLVHYHTSYY